MKRVLLMFLIFLSVPAVTAFDYFNVSDVNFLLTVTGSINIVAESAFEIKDFLLNLRVIPQDGLFSVDSDVNGELGTFGGDTVYVINKSSLENGFDYELLINYSKTVQPQGLSNLKLLVDVDYPAGIESYLSFDNFTTPDDEVREKASQLVEGKEYRLDAVIVIMDFVHDYITYDLNAAGSELKAVDWVWTNKIGTCDEYSVLAASMLRSVKIPVRFVHGYVYSDKINGFGPHSWLEVYVSDDWYAFDPTYAQYGLVDASHVPFSKTIGASFEQSSVQYMQKDASVNLSLASVDVQVLSVSEETQRFQVKTVLDRETYYEEDYALLTATITKPSTGSVLLPLRITTTKGLESILVPSFIRTSGKTSYVYAIFKTHKVEGTDTYFIHPILLEVPFANSASVELNNHPGVPQSSLYDIQKLLPKTEVPETFSAKVVVYYNATSYSLESPIIVSVKNTGNMALRDVEVTLPSMGASDTITSLLVNDEINITLPLLFTTYGSYTLAVEVLYNSNVITAYSFTMQTINKPNVTFNTAYEVAGDEHIIKAWFNDSNNAVLKSSIVSIDTGLIRESGALSGVKTYSFDDLDVGDEIVLQLSVVDANNTFYEYEEVLEVKRSFFQKLILSFKRFFLKIASS